MRPNALLRQCLLAASDDGQTLALELLSPFGAVRQEYGYTYLPGTAPIMLVAHTDTVRTASDLLCDPRKNVIWSPTGLGADDRAGVYAIVTLLRRGLRPHVLLTDGEESGGWGAQCAADDLLCPADVRCLVQMDRRGQRDAVYYSCVSEAMRRYARRKGWRHAVGTFSDIATLMPAWGVAGVNVSTGYMGEHTQGETLRLDWLQASIARVENMVRNPPRQRIPYEPALGVMTSRQRFDFGCEAPDDYAELYAQLLDADEERDALRAWSRWRDDLDEDDIG